jgi:hypothetical protein
MRGSRAVLFIQKNQEPTGALIDQDGEQYLINNEASKGDQRECKATFVGCRFLKR